jgi:hypothetical protein
VQITIETITPTQAAIWLNANTNNRPIRRSLVKQYAKEMKNGTWRLTHQGIAFGSDGTLLDGQHRLAAIVESDVAVTMLVTRGIDNRAQLVMDDHAKRSSGDALSLVRKEKITHQDVSVIRAVTELSSSGRPSRMSKEELNTIYDTFKLALEFISPLLPNEKGVSSAPVKGAIVLAWFYVADLAKLTRFCDVLSGRQMASDETEKPAVLLREFMLKHGMKSHGCRIDAFQKAQRAITAFVNGEKITKLYGASQFEWPLRNPIR